MNDRWPRRFQRYVALGDSSTEGLNDPDGRGGYRGWADRLAERIAAEQGGLLYSNHAVRGRRTHEILEQQLAPALAMKPDLATVFAGTNDVIAPRFDSERVAASMEGIQTALIRSGATVLTFTLPDLGPVMPLARPLAPRVRQLNEALRTVARQTGAVLVDFAAYPVGSDPRIWCDDRLHANALGHERVAAALAHALGLPGSDTSWTEPFAEELRLGPGERLIGEVRWARRYLLPWVWRHVRGRSSGDGRVAKRLRLEPIGVGPAAPRSSPAPRCRSREEP